MESDERKNLTMPNKTYERSLKPVLIHDKACLDASSLATTLGNLGTLTPWKGYVAILGDWLTIVLAVAVATIVDNLFVTSLSLLVIGSRQHSLLILLHDGAHYRLHPDKPTNDIITNLFIGYPHFVTVASYRKSHMNHHFHVNTNGDPDYVSKQGQSDWEFPKTRFGVLSILARQLCGAGALRILWLMQRYKMVEKKQKSPNRTTIIGKYVFYSALVALVVWSGYWKEVLLFWMVPLFTFMPLFLRVRSICEHFGLDDKSHDLNHTRNYHPNLFEQILFVPHNVFLHLDHHLFPTIPFYNLPAAHKLLQNLPQYANNAHQSITIFGARGKSVLDDLTKRVTDGI